jgi:Enoyl-CoA hydratase/carnithine racemase
MNMNRSNIAKPSHKDQAILEKIAGPVLTLTLNRPHARNAIDFELAEGLVRVLRRSRTRAGIRVLVLRGAGAAFSAGGDLKLFHRHVQTSDRAFRKITALLNQAIQLIRSAPQPVIAAVQGYAFAAGFGLALACDIVVAAVQAKLSPSFVNIALAPNASTSFFLPRILGKGGAADALMRGRVFTAKQALDLGLVQHVWPNASFEKHLTAFCSDLAERPTATLTRIKRLLNASFENSLKRQLALERKEIAASSLSRDFHEGVHAFVEKRRPKFIGK